MNVQIFQRLPKEKLAGQAKAVDAAVACLAKVDLVQIGFQNVVFLVMPFQQNRHQGFVTFAHQGLVTGQEKVLYQLLGQGTAALHNLPGFNIRQHGPGNRQGRNAVMLVKLSILNRHQPKGQQLRHLIKTNQHPVLPVGGIDTADLGRFQPDNRGIRAGDHRKRLNTVSRHHQ